MKRMAAVMMGLMLFGSLLTGCGSQENKTVDSGSESTGSSEGGSSESAESAEADEEIQQAEPTDGVKSEEAFTLRIVCSGEADDGIDIWTRSDGREKIIRKNQIA